MKTSYSAVLKYKKRNTILFAGSLLLLLVGVALKESTVLAGKAFLRRSALMSPQHELMAVPSTTAHTINCN